MGQLRRDLTFGSAGGGLRNIFGISADFLDHRKRVLARRKRAGDQDAPQALVAGALFSRREPLYPAGIDFLETFVVGAGRGLFTARRDRRRLRAVVAIFRARRAVYREHFARRLEISAELDGDRPAGTL